MAERALSLQMVEGLGLKHLWMFDVVIKAQFVSDDTEVLEALHHPRCVLMEVGSMKGHKFSQVSKMSPFILVTLRGR